MNMRKATFAGGSFWYMVEPFITHVGVKTVTVGYIGEDVVGRKSRNDERIERCEVVEILYDEDQISYTELLGIFWNNVDPTDASGQFSDRGNMYRSAIFYHESSQMRLAEFSLEHLRNSRRYIRPIVIRIHHATEFTPVEEFTLDTFQQQSARFSDLCPAATSAQRASALENTRMKSRKRISMKLLLAILPIVVAVVATVISFVMVKWREFNLMWPVFYSSGADTSALDEWRFDEILGVEDIIADVENLVQFIEEIHPIFTNEPPQRYLDAKTEFLSAATQSMTREQYWLMAVRYMASLEDDNTLVEREKHLDLHTPMYW